MRAGGDRRDLVVTGGAGFVGSSLALGLRARHPDWRVRVLDNLKRRGSELSLSRLAEQGIQFVHGDVRNAGDLSALGAFDLLIDCSAEPSVLAGLDGSPSYLIDTNLVGTLNMLEAARARQAGLVFLSTSRVYPIAAMEQLAFAEQDTRFTLTGTGLGHSSAGISEAFPLEGARSLYGASKLCSELMIQEYVAAFGLRAVIDRCGVLTGPWQMGKVDQGVIMHWVASHIFDKPLRYIGYGGQGKQVRDLLHVSDLLELVDRQIAQLDELHGEVFNVGGGTACSLSLRELTSLCEAVTGRRLSIGSEPETRRADLRIYLSDCAKVQQRFGFAPGVTPAMIIEDIARWITAHRSALERVLFAS